VGAVRGQGCEVAVDGGIERLTVAGRESGGTGQQQGAEGEGFAKHHGRSLLLERERGADTSSISLQAELGRDGVSGTLPDVLQRDHIGREGACLVPSRRDNR